MGRGGTWVVQRCVASTEVATHRVIRSFAAHLATGPLPPDTWAWRGRQTVVREFGPQPPFNPVQLGEVIAPVACVGVRLVTLAGLQVLALADGSRVRCCEMRATGRSTQGCTHYMRVIPSFPVGLGVV